jgi:hypothetical protein
MTKAELVQEMAAAVREQRAADREAQEVALAALRAEVTELRELVKAIPVPNDGKDGLDADHDAIVAEVLAQIPVPKDGRDGVDGKDGEPGKDATVDVDAIAEKAAALIPAPKDGEPGKDAEPIDTVALAKDVLALIPTPRDGRDGIATYDELNAAVAKAVGERVSPEVKKEVAETVAAMPVMVYRGVFQEGTEYKAGHMVTWAGSLWHANEATTEKPGDGKTMWTLAAKKGRDGKDAVIDFDAIVKAVRAKVGK